MSNTFAIGNDGLIIAITNGDLPRVKELIKSKADVNAKDAKGATPLMMASLNGNEEIVITLIEAKADVNAKGDNGATALFLASSKGHKNIVNITTVRLRNE